MPNLTASISPSMQTSLQPVPDRQDPLRKAAQQLEATFLAEMLKSAGLGESRESFGGGSGEDQFSTFLVRAQAEQMAQAGGIGLAESLYNSMKEAQND
ncbi:rod-binding protein [Parasedimentitalea huanghaiensis]